MKKLILTVLAAAALGFGASGVQAQDQSHTEGSDLNAGIDFDKTVTVIETITKVKTVNVVVRANFEFRHAAESIVVVNQDTRDGVIDTSGGNPNFPFIPPLIPDPGLAVFNILPHLQLTAEIIGSLNDNSGIVQFNQDSGNTTNQGNTLSAAVAFNAGLADSMASAQQTTTNNQAISTGPNGTQRYARIIGSGNNNSGALMVNQNVGNGNNQLNAASIAVAKGSAVVALSEADLGQFNTFNTVDDFGSVRRNLISDSFNGNSGIVAANQAGGNHINQGTVISISGAVQ